MNDFRTRFYQKYNSTFKQEISNFSHTEIKNEWKYYDYKYLPMLKKYPSDARILEIGCGRGFMLEYLNNKGYKVTEGIDISEEQIKIAKSKNLNVSVADVFSFLSNSELDYDIIILIDIIEHFSKNELLNLFDLIFKRLKSKGMLILHTPNGQAIFSGKLIYGDLTHMTILTPNSLTQILKLFGFDEIRFFERGPVNKNLVGCLRSFIWVIIKFIYNIFLLVESGKKEHILTQNFICTAKKE
jgi:2-polyprenyl-3-methyl-5-hydroxy-6-metoxy-1,4-benzoquinol methylase